MQPAVSVLIPAYNASSTIPACLESVCKQTLNDIEILVIDDGSTDDTPAVIRAWQEKDTRIRIVSQMNFGPGPARNRGIAEAKGRYLFFLDADDCMAGATVLEMLYKNAEEKHVLACGGSFEVDEGDRRNFHPDSEMKFQHKEILHYRDWQYDYGYYRFIFRTDVVRDNNVYFPSLLRYQDPVFFVKVLTLVDTFYVIPLTTYVWTLHEVSWNTRKVEDLLEGIVLVAQFAKEHGLQKLLWRQMLRLIVEYKHVVLKRIYSESRLSIVSRIIQCAAIFATQTKKVKNPCETLLTCFEITPLDILVARHGGMI